ncbi:MAG: hypothetical protein RIQ60_2604 [Pseudomonadota bacterium]|jgi:hypothetical protein
MTPADKPKHLTPSQQADAIAEWGRSGSYACCACKAECRGRWAVTLPTPYGFHMGTCHACARKMRLFPAYRRQARTLATAAAKRTLYQRTADLAGVTGAALLEALPCLHTTDFPTVGQLREADARLGLPLQTLERALMRVLHRDQPQ